ncbi:unnamed protein product [Arctogadus glacialis]
MWFFLWQSKPSELYDVVRFETQEKSGVLPSKTRKLTATVSVYPVFLSKKAPPVPKRGSPLRHTLSKRLTNTSSKYSQIKTTAMDPERGERARATMPQKLSEGPDEMGRRPLSTESIDRSHNEYPTQYKNHDYSGSSPVEKRSMYQPILDRDTVEDTPMVTLRTTDYTVATEEGHLRPLLPSYTKGCHETAGQDRPPDGRPLFPQIQPALPAL